MNIEIIYASMTGHTRRVAEAMAEELGVEAKDVKDSPKFDYADIVFLGSGIYASKPDKELCTYARRINEEKAGRVVLFYTSMTGIATAGDLRDILEQNGLKPEDHEFSCKGKFLFFSRKHPDQDDIAQARGFARATLERIEAQIQP